MRRTPMTLSVSSLAVLCFCVVISTGLRAQTDTDGDGLREIWNLTELNNVRNNPGSGYELMADLDFSDPTARGYQEAWDPEIQVPKGDSAGPGWVPIGNGGYINLSQGDEPTNRRRLSGTFEGNGHTISNLYVNLKSPGRSRHPGLYAGLFGFASGTLRNLGLTGEHMAVSASIDAGESYAGGLVGGASGEIRNCYATGEVTASSSNRSAAGGLVGEAFGAIRNCYATGEVTGQSTKAPNAGTAPAGGLVGLASHTGARMISNCYATGNVTGSGNAYVFAGGLVGGASSFTTIRNCYATGSVTGGGAAQHQRGGVHTGVRKMGPEVGGVLGAVVDAAIPFATGFNGGSGAVVSCYYSGSLPSGGVELSTLGTVKTLEELRTPIAPGSSGETYDGWSANDWFFGKPRRTSPSACLRWVSGGAWGAVFLHA